MRSLPCWFAIALAGCSGEPVVTPDGGDVDMAGPSQTAPVLLASPSGSQSETEPTIAVAPDGRLAVAWLDVTSGGAPIGFAFSPDRGDTWSASQLLQLGGGRFASNEIVAADAQSNFHLVTMAVAANQMSVQVLIATAPAGTSSFGAFTEISDPAVAVPRDATAFTIAHDGSFNVVWTEYSASLTSSQIVAARSTDGGAHWTRTNITPGALADAWPNICASRTSGKLAAVFVDSEHNATGLRWSDDDGGSWPDGNVNMVPLSSYEGEFPSCLAIDNELWVMQGVASTRPSRTYEPTLDDIQLTHSGDGGPTLDATVSAQDPMAGGKYMRAMAVLLPDRRISLTYYAGASDDDPAATVRRSLSSDGGKHFAASQMLYQPILLTTSRAGSTWLGDLLGVTADDHGTYVSFVDNGAGKAHIRFTRLMP
jgi:hypothetical protein